MDTFADKWGVGQKIVAYKARIRSATPWPWAAQAEMPSARTRRTRRVTVPVGLYPVLPVPTFAQKKIAALNSKLQLLSAFQ